MAITYGDHLIDTGANEITPEQEREIETREECDLNDHLPLRYEDTPDYCEVFDKNGEKVALTARPDLFRALELRAKDDFFNMLWKWFEERRGVEDMRANIPYGLSADDFKDMLDEHEATCVAAHAQEYRAPVAPPDITGRSAMQRLLDAAGWDAGSLRHRQLLDALAGSQLEIVPNFRLSCGHELIDPSKPCEVCATADQPHARP